MSRISELRRRDWTTCDPAAASEISAAFNPSGLQVLRPIQAMAVRESLQVGGVWAAARVGAGKTLIAAILATIYEDQRPLVIVPGGHGDKTELEFAGYRKMGWQLSHKIQVITYNDLARDVDEKLLRGYEPGRLICDEVDKLRRVGKSGAGTAKRVAQYMAAQPTYMDAMSGTMFKEGLKDYGHILNWVLKSRAPVPELPVRIAAWHRALKDGTAPPSVWKELTGGVQGDDFRRAYRERLWHTPGVLISVDAFDGVPLTLERVSLGADGALAQLYEAGVTPDGLDVVEDGGDSDAEGIDGAWAVERQMALGFYYKPDLAPPQDWAKARRAWFRFVRKMVEQGHFNTELQVRRWAKKNDNATWRAWEAIQPTFQPRFVPVWLNDNAIEFARAWGSAGGIVWTDHRAFAARLSAETGWRWFAGGGRDASGMMIEQCRDQTIIASRQANGTGRNLQHWCRGLITAFPGNGRDAEQLLGRQHRDGQMNPVHVDVLTACRAHHADIAKVIDLSNQELEEMGRQNKILTAGWG